MMFIPLDTKSSQQLRPLSSGISENDWAILADFWYPVAMSRDLADVPRGIRLLDVDVALFRDADGSIGAVLDTCPHRHVRLSPGNVVGGQIECPFHGLRFDVTGLCRHVPALGAGHKGKLPASYCVKAFVARERYGLVWLCLGDTTRHDIPEFPALRDIDPDELGYNPPIVWPASAPRQVENFFDLAHLPIAHAGTLGGDRDAPVKPGRVEHSEDAVILYAQATSGAAGHVSRETLTYRVVLPFCIDFLVETEGGERVISCDMASPISATHSVVFQIFRIDGDKAAHEAFGAGLRRVNDEDIALLSTIQTPNLPLDQHHEIHLPVDNMASAYRSRLRDLGLGRS